jgi:hypothetical protein
MDGLLIDSIAEATDTPLDARARFRLRVDNFAHQANQSVQERFKKFF